MLVFFDGGEEFSWYGVFVVFCLVLFYEYLFEFFSVHVERIVCLFIKIWSGRPNFIAIIWFHGPNVRLVLSFDAYSLFIWE